MPFGELRAFSGDTVGAYGGGAIGGYCPIDLVKIPHTPVAALTVQNPILYCHGKVPGISQRHRTVRVLVVAGTHGNRPGSIESRVRRSSLRILREQERRDSEHDRNERCGFHKRQGVAETLVFATSHHGRENMRYS
jgi:hypothetical protein